MPGRRPRVRGKTHIPGARVAFQRGFLHRANFVELSDYLDTDPRDWQRVPLEELGLLSRGSTSAEQWATRRTDWSRLRLLTLRNDWKCDDLAAVLSQPSLEGLNRLRLENVHAREEGSEIARQRLSEAIRLPALEGLLWIGCDPLAMPGLVLAFAPLRRLDCTTYTPAEERAPGWDWLIQSHHWGHLEQISIRNIKNFDDGCGDLFESPSVPNFRSHFGIKAATDLRIALADLIQLTELPSAWRKLHTLRIGHQSFSSELLPLRDCSCAASLSYLHLQQEDGYDPRDIVIVPDLFERAAFSQLRCFRVDLGLPSNAELDALAAASFRESLLELHLKSGWHTEGNPLNHLLGKPWPWLHTLSLGLRPEEWADFASTRQLPNLCTLRVNDYPADESLIHRIAANPHMPHLSLIQTEHFGRPQWIVREGKAYPVPGSVDLAPVDGFDGDLAW